MCLRLTVAETCAHRTRIRAGRAVELRYGPCEARLRHMAESTGFIAAHRELIVIEHRFAKQLDLLHLVIGR